MKVPIQINLHIVSLRVVSLRAGREAVRRCGPSAVLKVGRPELNNRVRLHGAGRERSHILFGERHEDRVRTTMALLHFNTPVAAFDRVLNPSRFFPTVVESVPQRLKNAENALERSQNQRAGSRRS
jgi:hypothetical protein